jgi:hypothetical protein
MKDNFDGKIHYLNNAPSVIVHVQVLFLYFKIDLMIFQKNKQLLQYSTLNCNIYVYIIPAISQWKKEFCND